ncbi:MAG: FtsX-like permease family protein, partial [Actinomycetota bacterium]|nr:FtsX-like permease family protein [Actinomycetota bacterium]
MKATNDPRSRRTLARWALRLLRREWRSQLLVVGLITVAVTLAATGAVLVHHLTRPASAFTGSATHELRMHDDDPARVRAGAAEVAASFDDADVTLRRAVEPAGRTSAYSIISPPDVSAFGAETVRLVDGSRPAGPGQATLSRSLADTLDAGIGSVVGLAGESFEVVGLVENPAELDERFAAVVPDALPEPHQASVLVRSDEATIDRAVRTLDVDSRDTDGLEDELPIQLIGVAQIYVFSAFLMIEVALLCTAGFAVLAQRRMRQYGLLAALGATRRQLRTACHLQGLTLGLVGGALGVALAYLGSLAARSLVEELVNQRFDRWDLPWFAAVPFVVLGVLTALGGSWWPAQTVARLPVVDALAARRPGGEPSGRTSTVAVAVALLGVLGVVVGFVASPGRAATK